MQRAPEPQCPRAHQPARHIRITPNPDIHQLHLELELGFAGGIVDDARADVAPKATAGPVGELENGVPGDGDRGAGGLEVECVEGEARGHPNLGVSVVRPRCERGVLGRAVVDGLERRDSCLGDGLGIGTAADFCIGGVRTRGARAICNLEASKHPALTMLSRLSISTPSRVDSMHT